MVIIHRRPEPLDSNVIWSKPEEIFDYMLKNNILKVHFTDEKSTLKNISSELGKYFFVTNEKTRTMVHANHTYEVKLFEPSPIFLNGILHDDIPSQITIALVN